MDVHVPGAITSALRQRGVDVVTAQEDGRRHLQDRQLLTRATELGRAFFSMDEDLLAEAALRQRRLEPFAGLIYARQLGMTIGQCVHDLELLTKVYDPQDLENRVEYLPLQ